MGDKTKEIITLATNILVSSNIAVPIIFGAVTAIASIIKGVTGNGPALPEIADLIAAQLQANDTAGKAEIARLKSLLPSA